MREVSPTYRGGRVFPGSKPRAHKGFKVVNLIEVQAMFDEKKRFQRKKLAQIYASTGGNGSQATSTAEAEIRSVVNDVDEVICNIIRVGEKAKNCHTVHSRHRSSEKDIRASVRAERKARSARITAAKAGNVDAPTNLKEDFRVADALFESSSIGKDGSGSVSSADAPNFPRTRSLQAAGDSVAV